MLRVTFWFLLVLVTFPVAANTLAEDIEEIVALLLIEEELKTQHKQCIESSANITESEIRHGLDSEYSDVEFDADDIALLVSIYADFYTYGCSYLAGNEAVSFFKAEIRKRFYHEEIIALIDFYKTPLGRKLNAQWFEINTLYGNILQERQLVDAFEAQRRYEEQMEKFWIRLEEKETTEAKDGDA